MLIQDVDGVVLSLREIGTKTNNTHNDTNAGESKLYDVDFRYKRESIEINPISNIWIPILRLQDDL